MLWKLYFNVMMSLKICRNQNGSLYLSDLGICFLPTRYWTLLFCSFMTQSPVLSRLIKLLEQIMDGSKLLIFMETKRGCDQVTRQLRMDGWPALSIHGDKSQAERDWVLSEFKAGKSPIMTATDVAARGLGMCRKAFHMEIYVLKFLEEVALLFSILVVHCVSLGLVFLTILVYNVSIVVVNGPGYIPYGSFVL